MLSNISFSQKPSVVCCDTIIIGLHSVGICLMLLLLFITRRAVDELHFIKNPHTVVDL